ncbi:MAG: flagellar biosynthetic protein FliO [Burkholderiales bacterium]|nr:flagellar biosynthetic protein FliO [Burkholderiales bacterium]
MNRLPVRLAATAAALFAAPGAAADPATGPAGLIQMLPGLAIVIALIVGLAWLARRFGAVPAGGAGRLRVVDQRSVGTRERVVIVEVGEQWLVLGVAPGSVSRLSRMPRPPSAATPDAPAPGAPPFAAWLARARGRS